MAIALIARLGRGVSLRPTATCQTAKYANAEGKDEVQSLDLDAAAVLDGNRLAVFLVNRTSAPLAIEEPLSDLGRVHEVRATQVQHDDLMATNTWEKPQEVAPRGLAVQADGARIHMTLPAYAFAALEASVFV